MERQRTITAAGRGGTVSATERSGRYAWGGTAAAIAAAVLSVYGWAVAVAVATATAAVAALQAFRLANREAKADRALIRTDMDAGFARMDAGFARMDAGFKAIKDAAKPAARTAAAKPNQPSIPAAASQAPQQPLPRAAKPDGNN